MPNVITLKVDVRKLDKARFFEGKEDKDGHRPLYADLVLIPRKEAGRYGDTHMVVQSKKKEETIQMPIIGNATERGYAAAAAPPAPKHANPQPPAQPITDEDVPF